MVVAAVDSDSDLTMIECKFDQFKKLTSKAAKKEAGTTHVHLWEYGVNSIDAFNEQPLIEITDE